MRDPHAVAMRGDDVQGTRISSTLFGNDTVVWIVSKCNPLNDSVYVSALLLYVILLTMRSKGSKVGNTLIGLYDSFVVVLNKVFALTLLVVFDCGVSMISIVVKRKRKKEEKNG